MIGAFYAGGYYTTLHRQLLITDNSRREDLHLSQNKRRRPQMLRLDVMIQAAEGE